MGDTETLHKLLAAQRPNVMKATATPPPSAPRSAAYRKILPPRSLSRLLSGHVDSNRLPRAVSTATASDVTAQHSTAKHTDSSSPPVLARGDSWMARMLCCGSQSALPRSPQPRHSTVVPSMAPPSPDSFAFPYRAKCRAKVSTREYEVLQQRWVAEGIATYLQRREEAPTQGGGLCCDVVSGKQMRFWGCVAWTCPREPVWQCKSWWGHGGPAHTSSPHSATHRSNYACIGRGS